MDYRVPKLHPDPDTEQSLMESLDNESKNGQASHKKLNTGVEKHKDPPSEQPKGVPKAMWQRFQTLQNKRMAMTKTSREARAKEVRNEVLQKVKNQFNEADLEILKEYNVSTVEEPGPSSRKRPKESEKSSAEECNDKRSKSSEEGEEDWSSVRKYIDVNKHLDGVDRGRHAPKTKLEENIDAAIARGDYDRAESLSNDLATRDFGKKIADAFDAKRYSDQKQKDEALTNERKKRKVAWRFDHKERWETKGNM